MAPRVLVAGIGNIFLADDGFGVEVARRLAGGALPPEAAVVDVGIRSLHLAYALLEGDGPELLLVVDAVQRGDAPGTLTLLEPTELEDAPPDLPEAHGINLGTVVGTLRALGGRPPPILLLACEAESFEPRIGLSPTVERALPGAEQMVKAIVTNHLVHAARAAPEPGGSNELRGS